MSWYTNAWSSLPVHVGLEAFKLIYHCIYCKLDWYSRQFCIQFACMIPLDIGFSGRYSQALIQSHDITEAWSNTYMRTGHDVAQQETAKRRRLSFEYKYIMRSFKKLIKGLHDAHVHIHTYIGVIKLCLLRCGWWLDRMGINMISHR